MLSYETLIRTGWEGMAVLLSAGLLIVIVVGIKTQCVTAFQAYSWKVA